MRRPQALEKRLKKFPLQHWGIGPPELSPSLGPQRKRRCRPAKEPTMSLRAFLTCCLVMTAIATHADAPASSSDRPFTVEYYYRIKWGQQEEWMELYRRSHWPIMVEEMKQGYILDVQVHQPHTYEPDPYRWDVRVSITYKSVLVPFGMSDRDREQTLARLFPDREQQARDERRRKELLEALWEVAIKPVATAQWQGP
jgi:hypothetical protein